jgi:predicted dehydrogenase
MSESQTGNSRRSFLKNSTAAAVGTSLLSLTMPQGVHASTDDWLRIGAIGLGGRGSGAVLNALQADSRAKLVAVGDAFEDRLKSSMRGMSQSPYKDRIEVDEEHMFAGFDAYQKVIDSDVDVVILTTPPHFRPMHLKYAVEKGKHCFVEKPVGVDVPGILSVQETCKEAERKGLAIVSGLCWRYDTAVRETMQRIQDGAIGDIVSMQSEYITGLLWHRGDDPSWSRMEYQMRNWLYYTWLSGDHICEQAVHSLDKTAWLLGDISPIRAWATGGRQQRTGSEFGHIYDHFAVVYEYPNNVRVHFYCRQQSGCYNHTDEFVMGTKGQAEPLANAIHGPNQWKFSGPTKSMYDLEHDAFFASIRAGKPINNGHYMCNSSMLAVLGRACAYTGQQISWEQLLTSQERLGPEVYEWDEVPEPEVAIPGVTKFV